ncbi:MAG: aminotransferase class I/II-fold pyridoxal phosphate-dependent enzyme, partial [Alphaproteobacteria bacterium GM7ARS4]|nr:aminotransferase class I/II-fold pyridoxal phosphate-dependent enzyme [Alphaproteobacteria bacterium GM7ARS4]
MIKPLSHIADVTRYKSGASQALVRDSSVPIFKLSSNESVFGASPKAIARGKAWLAQGKSHLYSSGACAPLREALGRRYGVKAGQIVCGNGSDELIAMLVRAYCGVGDEVVMSRYGFIYYRIVAQAVGAVPVFADVGEAFEETRDRFLRACSKRTKIIFIANPNNPTGYLWRAGALTSLCE